MLTEGWDANTVTHVLGVRPFRSQLLCEQVVGRGLRRRSYAIDERTGHFAPEYAEVYGVPFSFLPGDKTVPKGTDPRPAVEVRTLLDRADLSIRFPKLDGYRIELPDEELEAGIRRGLGASSQPGVGRPLGREPGVVGAAASSRPPRGPQCAPAASRLRDRQGARHTRAVLRRDGRRREAVAVPAPGGDQQAVARRMRHDGARHDDRQSPAVAGARARRREGVRLDRPPSRQPRSDRHADHPALRPRGQHRRGPLPHPQGRHGPAADEVPAEPRRARRPERQLVGGGACADPRARPACPVLRQERAARLHDPVRPPGVDPRVRPRLPRAPEDRARRRRAHADRRGVGHAEVGRHGERQGHDRARPMVRRREQLGSARACGATSRSATPRWPTRPRPSTPRSGGSTSTTATCSAWRGKEVGRGTREADRDQPRSTRSRTPTSARTSRPPTRTSSSRRRSRSPSRSATRATRRSIRSSSGRARTSSTARISSPTRHRSTSRRRSTRAS